MKTDRLIERLKSVEHALNVLTTLTNCLPSSNAQAWTISQGKEQLKLAIEELSEQPNDRERLKVVSLNDPLTTEQLCKAGRAAGEAFDALQLWGSGDVLVVWQDKNHPGKRVNLASCTETAPGLLDFIKICDQRAKEKGDG